MYCLDCVLLILFFCFIFFSWLKSDKSNKSKAIKAKTKKLVNDKALACATQNVRGWRALVDVSKRANHDRDVWTIPKRIGFHRCLQCRRRCRSRRSLFGRGSRMAGLTVSMFPAPMTVNITVFSENAWKIGVIKCKLGKDENGGMIGAIICKWDKETKSNVGYEYGLCRGVILLYIDRSVEFIWSLYQRGYRVLVTLGKQNCSHLVGQESSDWMLWKIGMKFCQG